MNWLLTQPGRALKEKADLADLERSRFMIATGQSADTDTVVASVKAYVQALNRLLVRREKLGPGADAREISYKELG